MNKIVFPTAELLLTFRPLDQIPLPELLDCDSVEVLFAAIVLDALVDDQWHHPLPELRRRAPEVLADVDEWLMAGQPIRPGVTVTVLAGQPRRTTIERYRLDWQDRTDLLCGLLLEYRQKLPEEEIVLLSGDDAVRERARELGLESAGLPEKQRLPGARTALAEQKERSDEASAGFRYRTASLQLSFDVGGSELVVPLLPQLTGLTPAMQVQLEEVTEDVRRALAQYFPGEGNDSQASKESVLPAGMSHRSLAAPDALPDGVSAEAAARYKRELKAYPALFESYLHGRLAALNEQRRTIRLDLSLENVGGAPAADVLLTLTLPAGLQWQKQSPAKDLHAPPPPPVPPWLEGEAEAGTFLEGGSVSAEGQRVPAAEVRPKPPGSTPRISDEGRTLHWQLGSARHQQDRDLPPLAVRFHSAEEIDNFAIDYEIEEKKTASAVSGRLLVKVRAGPEGDASPTRV